MSGRPAQSKARVTFFSWFSGGGRQGVPNDTKLTRNSERGPLALFGIILRVCITVIERFSADADDWTGGPPLHHTAGQPESTKYAKRRTAEVLAMVVW